MGQVGVLYAMRRENQLLQCHLVSLLWHLTLSLMCVRSVQLWRSKIS